MGVSPGPVLHQGGQTERVHPLQHECVRVCREEVGAHVGVLRFEGELPSDAAAADGHVHADGHAADRRPAAVALRRARRDRVRRQQDGAQQLLLLRT